MRRCLNCMEEYPDGEDRCPYCGYAEGATQNGGNCLPAGTILQARYIVGTPCQVRDMDILYRAWDALFDRKICIQEYFPSQLASRSGQAQITVMVSGQERFQEGLRLFRRDSRELIRLYKEEDIITYHACFPENGTAYAVMDYREDPTLEDWLEQQPIDRKMAKLLADRALDAVKKCHRIGVNHGRVTARSFYITANGLILKDFGAWAYPCTQTEEKASVITPEEADNRAVSALYYQMLTGKGYPDKKETYPEAAAAGSSSLSAPAEHGGDDKESSETEIAYIPTSKKQRHKKKSRQGLLEKKMFFEVPFYGVIAGGAAALVFLLLVVFLFFHLGSLSGGEKEEDRSLTETSEVQPAEDEPESLQSGMETEPEMTASSETGQPESSADVPEAETTSGTLETSERTEKTGEYSTTAAETAAASTTAAAKTAAASTTAAAETTAASTTAAAETTAVSATETPETTIAAITEAVETIAAPTMAVSPETEAPTAADSDAGGSQSTEVQTLMPIVPVS